MLQLFTFVRADLTAYRPHHRDTPAYGEASVDGFGELSTSSPSEPRFPKSLYLIKPLFGAYELNAVALTAQASVPVPEGLELDAWIVPMQEEPVPLPDNAADETLEGKKGKKGKRKDGGKTKRKGKARAREDDAADEDGEAFEPGPSPAETAEERAERERVRIHITIFVLLLCSILFLYRALTRYACGGWLSSCPGSPLPFFAEKG